VNWHQLFQPLAQWLQSIPARDKRVILAGTDGCVGASVAWAVLGGSFAVALCVGLIAGFASRAIGLDRTKLNAFLQSGIHRSLAQSVVVSLAIAVGLALTGDAPSFCVSCWRYWNIAMRRSGF
jgi:hypothetical protein